MLTKLPVIDNSGALLAQVIRILNKKSTLGPGSLVVVTIKKALPNSKIRKGDVLLGIIVTGPSKSLVNRFNSDKSIVLVKRPPKGNDFLPLANRIKKPISSALRNIEGMNKIISLSKKSL